MYLNLNINLDKEITEKLENYIKEQLPILINEYFFSNPNELNKIIRDCLKGQLKATACEIFQGKEIRNVLAERIMEQLSKDD